MKVAKEVSKSAFRKQLPSHEGQDSQDFRNERAGTPTLAAASMPREPLKAMAGVKSSFKPSTKSSPIHPRSPIKPISPEKRDAVDEEGKRVLERQYYSADVSAVIDGEKYDHRAYIYGYKVATCQAWLHGKCGKEDSECFDSHCNPPLRRKPHLQHGRFNYIPTRCRYLTEKEECPQTIHCRFAHCTEEVIYHPSKFRTQLCQHGLDSRGICEGYGYHCAKAHSESDLRPAVYETMDNPACLFMTLDERSDFVCAVEKQKEERHFYSYVYKTRRCAGYPYDCKCDGVDYHRGHERRRAGVIKYLPMACPNIKPFPKSEWGDPYDDSKCVPVSKPKKERKKRETADETADEEIWDCQYAHTLMEVMYHPQVYKTDLCQHFDENDPANWRCVWKKRCAHAHGQADLRTKEDAVQEWKAHMGDAVKNRKLPSLVEQIIAAPQQDSSELARAMAEEFNQRGLEEDRKNSRSSLSLPKNSSFSKLAPPFEPNPTKTPHPASGSGSTTTGVLGEAGKLLHNVHARQNAAQQPPRPGQRRTPPPPLPSDLPPTPPPPQQQQVLQPQQAMQLRKNELQQQQQQQLQLQQQQQKLPRIPSFPQLQQPKQQLPPLPPPPQQKGDLVFLSPSFSPISPIPQQDNSLTKPKPPMDFRPQQQQLPPPPPVPVSTQPTHTSRLAPRALSFDHLSMLSDRASAASSSSIPRSYSALDILEEIKTPPHKSKDAWKTPPKPIEPQSRRQAEIQGPKYSPLFDLGDASVWSGGDPHSPPESREVQDEATPKDETHTSRDTSIEEPTKEELEMALVCPFSADRAPHLIVRPALTPCCGLSFCLECGQKYIAAVEGSIGWPFKCVELKDKYPASSSAAYVERERGRCICGHWISDEQIEFMLKPGRSNFTLAAFLDISRRARFPKFGSEDS